MGGKSMKVRKAIIPAAGLGTRFLPATKAQPKEMLPLVDKPLVEARQLHVEPCLDPRASQRRLLRELLGPVLADEIG